MNHNGGEWNKLDSVAKTQDWSFSAFGLFDVEGHGHTGYQTTNGVKYHNGNSNDTYVCGGGGTENTVAGSNIVYNNAN